MEKCVRQQDFTVQKLKNKIKLQNRITTPANKLLLCSY